VGKLNSMVRCASTSKGVVVRKRQPPIERFSVVPSGAHDLPCISRDIEPDTGGPDGSQLAPASRARHPAGERLLFGS